MGEANGKKPYQLFRRQGSLKWYCRFSVKDQGQFQRALNTEDEAEAERRAQQVWMRATIRGEQGQSVKERTFKDVAEEFLSKMEKEVANGEAPAHILSVDASSIKRYFIEFFGTKPIDAIKERDITRYLEWRKVYWVSGPGKNISTITYQRAGRTVSRPVVKDRKPTSSSRMRRELTVLKQILKQAVKWGYLPTHLMPEIELEKPRDNPRPGFTHEEFNRLLAISNTRCLEPPIFSHLWRERQKLNAYIVLAGYSGLRPGEMFNLNFGDIVGLPKAKEEYWNDTHDIRIRVRGKTGARTIVAKFDAVAPLRMLSTLWWNDFDREPADTDPVFFNDDGSRIKSMTKGLQGLLKEDHDGARRTRHSFRHFHITQQLIHGVDIYLLAKNTGTSSDMIHRFYGHVEVEKMSKELRPDWDKPLA